jgi:hypothetical protein
MSKIRCFKCDGKGKIVDIDPLVAVFSLGISALIDLGNPDKCNACNGTGYLENED